MTTIRSATPDDLEALAQLKNPQTNAHRALFASIAHERIVAAAHQPVTLLVAEEADRIVGQVLLRLDGSPTQPGYPSIQDLHVAADQRGQGIGTALLQHCEALACQRRYADISIAVNPTLNPRALALYERLGYQSTGAAPYLGGVYDGDEDWIIDLRKPLVALHPAAAVLLPRIRTALEGALGDTLVGLYLYGSLVSGDYDDGVSDIDLLAAIRADLTDAEYAALDAMHGTLIADAPEWNDRIEIAYLSLAGLQTFKTQASPIYVISPGEPFNAKTAGREWLMN
jgi:ribosomal protein S18 acetylase RimI-like enzyme